MNTALCYPTSAMRFPLVSQTATNLSSEDEVTHERERKIIARVQAGDRNSYRELVEAYQDRVLSIAIGLVGNHADAQDLTQEAFLKAYRNLPKFRGESSFYTWLYRILFNLSVDLGRKSYRKVEKTIGDAGIVDAIDQASVAQAQSGLSKSAQQRFENRELGLKIKEALNDLSPEHRSVVILREIEGLSYEEISEVMKCSKGTVMSRLFHARRKLQDLLSTFSPRHASNETTDLDPPMVVQKRESI